VSEDRNSTTEGLACLADPIVKLFDMAIRQSFAEEDKVRAEIKQKGTYWAAGEIYKLRRRVEMFERREREKSET